MIQVGACEAERISLLVQHDHRTTEQFAPALRARGVSADREDDDVAGVWGWWDLLALRHLESKSARASQVKQRRLLQEIAVAFPAVPLNPFPFRNGPWLSLVERLNGVQEAAGSNPAGPTT